MLTPKSTTFREKTHVDLQCFRSSRIFDPERGEMCSDPVTQAKALPPGLHRRDIGSPTDMDKMAFQNALKAADALLFDIEDKEEVIDHVPEGVMLLADSQHTRNRHEWEYLSGPDTEGVDPGKVMTQLGTHLTHDTAILDIRRRKPDSFATLLGA
ncbi:hypothetical protein EXE48_11855 [Halorubrum sp. ASP1]|uniref:hypothetical protein n=1 Tax=Halorubrum sp. ASP1 TaxID=2518114 RepID=UPI0010F6C823|nr:hypothetical protein [Halorubrum sp. ASP1]TKX60660.1 hypothetical protein EXE48_11855 [Halorubrum sp. ASP1]